MGSVQRAYIWVHCHYAHVPDFTSSLIVGQHTECPWDNDIATNEPEIKNNILNYKNSGTNVLSCMTFACGSVTCQWKGLPASNFQEQHIGMNILARLGKSFNWGEKCMLQPRLAQTVVELWVLCARLIQVLGQLLNFGKCGPEIVVVPSFNLGPYLNNLD